MAVRSRANPRFGTGGADYGLGRPIVNPYDDDGGYIPHGAFSAAGFDTSDGGQVIGCDLYVEGIVSGHRQYFSVGNGSAPVQMAGGSTLIGGNVDGAPVTGGTKDSVRPASGNGLFIGCDNVGTLMGSKSGSDWFLLTDFPGGPTVTGGGGLSGVAGLAFGHVYGGNLGDDGEDRFLVLLQSGVIYGSANLKDWATFGSVPATTASDFEPCLWKFVSDVDSRGAILTTGRWFWAYSVSGEIKVTSSNGEIDAEGELTFNTPVTLFPGIGGSVQYVSGIAGDAERYCATGSSDLGDFWGRQTFVSATCTSTQGNSWTAGSTSLFAPPNGVILNPRGSGLGLISRPTRPGPNPNVIGEWARYGGGFYAAAQQWFFPVKPPPDLTDYGSTPTNHSIAPKVAHILYSQTGNTWSSVWTFVQNQNTDTWIDEHPSDSVDPDRIPSETNIAGILTTGRLIFALVSYAEANQVEQYGIANADREEINTNRIMSGNVYLDNTSVGGSGTINFNALQDTNILAGAVDDPTASVPVFTNGVFYSMGVTNNNVPGEFDLDL